jgi:formamidopyrimidine-DNA glycosylase
MPELAEVEYYRKQWDPGVGARVIRVALHAEKRVLRGVDSAALEHALTGSKLLGSEARAKQMLFRFGKATSPSAWVGIHLGMSGHLHAASGDYALQKHDHFVLFQKGRALVFNDPRQFGRIRFHAGSAPPEWWTNLPPDILSREFTCERLESVVTRRGGSPVKALLLMQDFFPGVGNWMADEILWRARLNPRRRGNRLESSEIGTLWRETREVCRIALKTIGAKLGDPPADWFFHVRWSKHGECPRCGLPIKTATIGSRTTRWCAKCQK